MLCVVISAEEAKRLLAEAKEEVQKMIEGK